MRVKLNAMDKITLLEAVAAVIVAPASFESLSPQDFWARLCPDMVQHRI